MFFKLGINFCHSLSNLSGENAQEELEALLPITGEASKK